MRVGFAVWMVLLMALIPASAASADTAEDIRCWTSNEDMYYHIKKSCTGNEMFPISESAAVAFGKAPCESCCVTEETMIAAETSDMWMAHRGGTYVVCIPMAAVDAVDGLKEPEIKETLVCNGTEAEIRLDRLLTGDARMDFDRRLEADGWVYDSCRVPEIALGEDDRCMSTRQIGNKWYFVIRPEKSYGDSAEVRWKIAEWDVRMESYGTLTLTNIRGAECVSNIEVDDHSGAEAVYEDESEDMTMTVYRSGGVNTAVFYREGVKNAQPVALILGGTDTGTVLEGYINGKKQATYCCVLSDVELAGIVAGGKTELREV